MKDWLKNIFRSSEQLQVGKWRTANSIFTFLSTNFDTDGNLKDVAHDLPDEKRDDENKLRFAPGLMDAMFGAESSDDSSKRIGELTKLLLKIAKQGDQKAQSNFYNLVALNDEVIGIVDGFLKSIVDQELPIEPYLFGFAKDMALKTNNRNAVKFGIAIIGLCQNKSVIKELKVLGLHDEFTVFSAIALSNISDNLIDDLWELAQKVNGWGKIQLVDRLANMELSDEQREWLIRKGYKNSIMYEYLVYTCALNGKLHEKLESEKIDKELFKSAEEIIVALLAEHSPSEGISAYRYASSVVENFVHHAKTHTSDIANFLALHQIRDFLVELQKDINEQNKNGWTDDIISNCIIDISSILDSKDWRDLTYKALNSSDQMIYWNGKSAADKLEVDIWEIVWKKLQQKPLDSTAWYDVTHYAKQDKAEQVIEFALANLPLSDLGTGPKDAMGLGADYIKYQPLDTVITFLEDYPKKGEQIILTGLNSPVTRNRNMAIKVLAKWKIENWSETIIKQVNELNAIEPNKDTKLNLQKLLNGEEL